MSRKHDDAILAVWEKWPWLMDHFYIHCGDAGINLPGHSIFQLDQEVAPGGDFYIYMAEYDADRNVYIKTVELFSVEEDNVLYFLQDISTFIKIVEHLEPK